MTEYKFKEALPVWEKDCEKTMNHHLVFRSVISPYENVFVSVSCSNMYQMFINGKFIAEGPARAGHGYYRVDEIDISKYLTEKDNVVAFFVAGYYVENFYLIKQPSFLCAEIISNGKVISATGKYDFEAIYNAERVRKAARFSYQRTFCEYYILNGNNQSFITSPTFNIPNVELVAQNDTCFINREVPYPCYDRIGVEKITLKGKVAFGEKPINPNRNRFVNLTPDCAGFPLEELEVINSDQIEKGVYTVTKKLDSSFKPTQIEPLEYIVYKFKGVSSGFIELKIEAFEDCELMAVFDEIDVDGDVETYRMRETLASVIWKLPKGKHTLISNEPYIIQYLKIVNNSGGALLIENVDLIQFKFDCSVKPLKSGNERIDRIYNAAVETFRQNVLDIYMDCASRERAGWLCDSFFTSRVERELTGKSVVEKCFLENFLMPERFEHIEEGMLPMCYPADFLSGEFIPNWAMWYVLELEEYFNRTGDRDLIEKARKRVFDLVKYFEKFENESGLLEKLHGWIFVEWSPANSFVQDVNYPTNMLYSRMFNAISVLYDEEYSKKAKKIKEEINKQSFFNGFYHDHAVRNEDGVLQVVETDITETCQYYAFYLGCATKETHSELFNVLVNDFGAERAKTGKWKEIHASNTFIGNYLRMDILCNEGLFDKVLKDIEGFFGYMEEKTGTLWEMLQPTGSCSHGFASHVIVWLRKIFG